MLFNPSDGKLFGYDPIFAQFVPDMNSLAWDGIDIHAEFFQGNIKFAIAQVVADNLGIHSLFGFADAFTGNYPCRTCKMHRNDIRTTKLLKKGIYCEHLKITKLIFNYKTYRKLLSNYHVLSMMLPTFTSSAVEHLTSCMIYWRECVLWKLSLFWTNSFRRGIYP